MSARDRLNTISKRWDELDLTTILKEQIPLPRRYLLDHLLRCLDCTEAGECDAQQTELPWDDSGED